MRFAFYLSALVAPLAIAAPAKLDSNSIALAERQAAPVKPEPCVRNNAVTVKETEARAKAFAQAFIVDRNITAAFEHIAVDYINHNPLAQNGSDSAWGILSSIWGSVEINPLRTTFQNPQAWLKYEVVGFSQVVDRFRWEAGCIAEHWDQGEVFPSNAETTRACAATS
ncbi:hypothetical protein OPT61_g229 [Boeremia exigua]|uniref:Uncharacterized protein n=1 Tax=Boeremia exigua TaxID=749465 RepID=A0ACC2IUR2_9PLEO|nr:hypothetical protein OPT61_g229 [Boeremia exigua]